jgi:hypothetical protein
VGPRTGLNDVEKKKFLTLPGLELRPLGRQARSQSLYRQSYPSSLPVLCLFYDAVGIYTKIHGMIFHKCQIVKDVEGSGSDPIEILPLNDCRKP